MKNISPRIILTLLALTSVHLLSACLPKKDSKESGPSASDARVLSPQFPTSSSDVSSGSPSLGATGTSTSGGGTGIDGKVFESYIVDPTQLPAYKEFVGPLLANIKSENPNDPPIYDKVFKLKTWYIAPIDLDKISKDLLGISFIKNSTQQIARQTPKEIWIDKRLFDNMTSKEQGDLISHEWAMNLYLFKFMTVSELYKISQTVAEENKDNDEGQYIHPDQFDQAMPPEKPHPLDSQDNANIRYVTGWLLQNAQHPITEKEFLRVLYTHGFDKRFFNPETFEERNSLPDLKISGVELYQTIKGAALTGNMPDLCSGLVTEINQSCKVDIEEKSFSYKNIPIRGLYELSMSVGEGKKHLIEVSFFPGEEVALSAYKDSEGFVFYTFIAADFRQQVQIGDRLYTALLFFKKALYPQSGLILDTLIFKPGIITSIDKTRDPICLASAPHPINLINDEIWVHRSQTASKSFSHPWFNILVPPFVMCTPENTNK